MAKTAKNVLTRGSSGSIGNLVYRVMPDGSTYISRKHDFSRRKLSPAQKEHHERFRRASAYANEASKSQPIYAQLAKGTVLSPYNVAMADWFHPPVIRQIEAKEGGLLIWATDNIMVAGVRIVILDEQGKVIEEGEASCREVDGLWEYVPAARGRIVVEARDLAGNVVREEISE